MAAGFAKGVFQWLAADVATTVYTSPDLGFVPVAVTFKCVGIQSATDAASGAVDLQHGIGFAMSTTDRRCVHGSNNDADGTARTQMAYRTDCVAMQHIHGDVAPTGLLDFNGVSGNTFSAIVDDQGIQNVTVLWTAVGGDVNDAETVEFAEPAAAGNVTFNFTGGRTTKTPVALILAGSKCTGAAPTFEATIDNGLSYGFSTGATAAENVVIVGNSDDAAGTMDTDGYCQSGECLAQIVEGGGTAVNCRAKVDSFAAGSVTLNYLEVLTTGRKTIGLALFGGQAKAGSYTIDGATLNATATVSGLAFQPVGGLAAGRMTAVSTADTAGTEYRMSMGAWTSTTDRATLGVLDEDATLAVEIDTVVNYASMLAFPSTTGTLLASYDVNAVNSDGAQFIVDTAGGVASEFQMYLMFGSNAAVATPFPPWPQTVYQPRVN